MLECPVPRLTFLPVHTEEKRAASFDPEQGHILQEERRLLGDLQVALARLDAPDADLGLIGNALAQLEELFLMVVVGEFNAGKSAVINALLGGDYLPEGVVPTTSELVLIRHSDAAQQPARTAEWRCAACPSPGCRRSTWSTRPARMLSSATTRS